MGGARLFPRGPAVADHSFDTFGQSARMAEAYRRVGLTVEFIAVKNGGHDFEQVGDAPVFPAEVIHQKTIDFFQRYLVSAPWMRTER